MLFALLDRIDRHASGVRWDLATSPLVVAGTFGAIIMAIVLTLVGSRLAALALLPLSVVWVLCNGLVEGPTLLELTPSHGVTFADLVSVFAVLVALSRLLLGLPRGRRGSAGLASSDRQNVGHSV